jgi:tRNA wybutosine-synthesizing protein 2
VPLIPPIASVLTNYLKILNGSKDMTFKKNLSEKTDIPESLLPGSYQIIGDVLLMKLMKIKSMKQKQKIASSILELLPYVKTVCEIKGIEKEFRTPRIVKLAGKSTETIHVEHGIKYKIDAANLMFSKGNVFERQRLLKQVRKNEIIVDMFAGIGYFSLPLSKKCRKIYSIEKNPIAFKYLKENIKLNKTKNIITILGDNRKIKLDEKTDRIVMGYFPKTEKFLPAALKMLKKGGIIHFHSTYKENELWRKPLSDIRKYVKKFRIMNKKIVKSVAPRTYHVVMDIKVSS